MSNYFYMISGIKGMSFDTLKEAREYVWYCLKEKDDYQSTAIRGALGMSDKIICRRHIDTGTVKYYGIR